MWQVKSSNKNKKTKGKLHNPINCNYFHIVNYSFFFSFFLLSWFKFFCRHKEFNKETIMSAIIKDGDKERKLNFWQKAENWQPLTNDCCHAMKKRWLKSLSRVLSPWLYKRKKATKTKGKNMVTQRAGSKAKGRKNQNKRTCGFHSWKRGWLMQKGAWRGSKWSWKISWGRCCCCCGS